MTYEKLKTIEDARKLAKGLRDSLEFKKMLDDITFAITGRQYPFTNDTVTPVIKEIVREAEKETPHFEKIKVLMDRVQELINFEKKRIIQQPEHN